MKVTLKLRNDKSAPKGNKSHYYATGDNGVKYSVVNVVEMMKDAPKYEGMFLGWEAILINENNELEGWSLTRAKTWDELSAALGFSEYVREETFWEKQEKKKAAEKKNRESGLTGDGRYISVFLRIATGLLSKKTSVPINCFKTRFLVPVNKDIHVQAYRDVQEYIEAKPNYPVLVFEHTGEYIGKIPVMELKDKRSV